MNRQLIVIGVLTVAIISAWNSLVFLGWLNADSGGGQAWWGPTGNTSSLSSKPEHQLWRDIKKTVVKKTPDGNFDPRFDESVAAAEGGRVELPGVGFLLSSGLRERGDGEKEVTEFLLLPGHGGVAWCCGLAPIPDHEFSVLVECPNDTFLSTKTDPKSSAMFVSVAGTLRLQKDNSINSLYTLEDASIKFIDMRDVMPPNVRNLCLDRPLVP